MKSLILFSLLLASQGAFANKFMCELNVFKLDYLGKLTSEGWINKEVELDKETKFKVSELEFTLDAKIGYFVGGYHFMVKNGEESISSKTFATARNPKEKLLNPIGFETYILKSIVERASQVGVTVPHVLHYSSYNSVRKNWNSVNQALRNAFDMYAPLKEGEVAAIDIENCSIAK